MGTLREKNVEAQTAAAVAGPPPRLLLSPPKLDRLPAHIFSPTEVKKIQRLRRYFDSLEIVGEDSIAATGAGVVSTSNHTTASAEVTTMENDTLYSGDVIDEKSSSDSIPTLNGISRSGSNCANFSSDPRDAAVATEISSNAAHSGNTDVSCIGIHAAAPDSRNTHVEGTATQTVSSWFSWNFLKTKEAHSGAANASAESMGQKVTKNGFIAAGPRSSSKTRVGRSAKKEQHRHDEKSQEEEEIKLQWDEALWLEDDLILARYLRSYGWDADEARKQLLRTLLWRRREKPHHVSPNQVASFARSGSVYRKGFDIYGRAVIYFKPGRDSSTGAEMFRRYVVYTIERALESLDREGGVDQLVFVVDFSEWGILQLPRTEVSREIVSILNDHYTDVLATAFIVNAPSYFDPIWRLVSLMVHPDTAKKVIFVHGTQESCSSSHALQGGNSRERASDGNTNAVANFPGNGSTRGVHNNVLRQLIPFPYLEKCVGGESPLDYDHDSYWQAEREQYYQQSVHRRQQRQALQRAVLIRRRRQRQQCKEADADGQCVSGAPTGAPAAAG